MLTKSASRAGAGALFSLTKDTLFGPFNANMHLSIKYFVLMSPLYSFIFKPFK